MRLVWALVIYLVCLLLMFFVGFLYDVYDGTAFLIDLLAARHHHGHHTVVVPVTRNTARFGEFLDVVINVPGRQLPKASLSQLCLAPQKHEYLYLKADVLVTNFFKASRVRHSDL